MAYQRQMPSRSLPPERLRVIRRNQETISKRNMAVDAGKSAYVRGRNNGLETVPPGKKAPKPTGPRRNTDPGMNKNRIDPVARAKSARNAAIATNQGIISARNMAADAGRSTYVRGKNNGLVAVPNVKPRYVFKPRSSDMDPGFGPRRGVPTPMPGGRKIPRPTRPRKPGDRRA